MLSTSGRIAFAILLLSLPAVAPAQQIAIGQYALPNVSFSSGIGGITVGPDGALWFTEGANVGRITTAGEFTAEYPVPSGYGAGGITAGPDGALWFTESVGARIGRITMAGAITEYPVPGGGQPTIVTVGPDGALWFTEYTGNKIGRITTAGVVTAEYPVPTAKSGPSGIAAGPDGALWFTESSPSASKIGRITTAGAITEYPVPTPSSSPQLIAVGPDRALWFTEDFGNKIGRITTAGVIAEYPVPTANSYPYAIVPATDGALWFTEILGHNIGRITTAGAITEYPVPQAGPIPGQPGPITVGPHGELWFGEGGQYIVTENAVGEAFFLTANLSVSPASGSYRTNHTFTGSGFGPSETVNIFVRGVGSAVLATATADASGSFTVSAREPQAPFGPRLYVSVGRSSRKLGAASSTVAPNVVLNPTSGPVGSTVTAEGFGFPPFVDVGIYLGEQRAYLAQVRHGNVNSRVFEASAGSK